MNGPVDDLLERRVVTLDARSQPSTTNVFYPSRAERQYWEDVLTEALLNADDDVRAGSVTPSVSSAALEHNIQQFDFDTPMPFEDLIGWTIKQMKDGIVHVNHPRYFGLFNPAPTFPAQCADRIAAAFNPQLASAVTSPAAIAIENATIAAVCRRVGLPPEAAGHFTSGGSEANFTAVICALTAAQQDFAVSGARAFSGPPTFYVSRDSHLAWVKIAHQAGIGRSSARMIATDGRGRINTHALAEAIRADRANGCVPFMIAATAGTTNAGMIDPLVECCRIAHDEGVWYHVDGAWGGAVIASDRFRPLLAGIELADSVTIDAHKWFATTMGCGMFLTARPAALSAAFHVSASFMPPNGSSIDPYVTTAQWSRRFSGLRLFLSLAAAGWEGYGRHVEKSIALGKLLAKQLSASGWTVLNDPSLAVVCLLPPGEGVEVRTLVARVIASGRAWISAASFEGRDAVRACITHGETTPEDVGTLVDCLNSAL